MSYSKVFLILANLISTDTVILSPNPAPPKAHELSKYAGNDAIGPLFLKPGLMSYRVRTINFSNMV
jgi:hypothetical protein